MSASENTFIDTSTTTIAEIQTFILNCAKEGKKCIRVHNQNSPNHIFGEYGNFFITINSDTNNVTCIAVNHWNAHIFQFTFSISDGLGNWQWCNLNNKILDSNGVGLYNIKLVIGEYTVPCNTYDNTINKYVHQFTVDKFTNFNNNTIAFIPLACFNAYYTNDVVECSINGNYVMLNNESSTEAVTVKVLMIQYNIN